MAKEIWKAVNGFDEYFVSNKGRVYSKKRNKYLKPLCSETGYLKVGLWNKSKRKVVKIHRLVAEAFIENSNNKKCVNHIDGNKQNNCVSNLEWATHSENTKHACSIGLLVQKTKTVDKFSKDGKYIESFSSQKEAAKATGIFQSAISRCCGGGCKTAGGYIWKLQER